MTVTFINADSKQFDTIGSSNFSISETIYGVKVDVGIFLQESKEDKNFQRQYFKTSLDLGRFLKGVRGNALTSMIIDSVLSNPDFKMKIPLEKGNYTIKNAKYPKNLIIMISTEFLFTARYIVKIKSRKSWIESCNMKVYGKIQQ